MTALRATLLATSLLAAGPSAAQTPADAAPAQASPGAAPSPAAPAPATSSRPAAVPEPTVTRFGIGAGIGTSGTAPTLYVPLDVGPLRLELDGAYQQVGTSEASATTSRIGLGLFGLVPVEAGIRCPLGLRLDYARDDVSRAGAEEAIRIAAVVGGEWAPVPSVALGVEGQLGYSAGLGNAVSAVDVSAQAILRVFLSTKKSSAPAAAGAAQQEARPKRLKRCQRSSDCERPDICFDGYCRH